MASDARPPEPPWKGSRHPVVKFNNFVRKHTQSIEVGDLNRIGLTTIKCLTLSKLNEIIALAVRASFEKYGRAGDAAEAEAIRTEAAAEVARRLRKPEEPGGTDAPAGARPPEPAPAPAPADPAAVHEAARLLAAPKAGGAAGSGAGAREEELALDAERRRLAEEARSLRPEVEALLHEDQEIRSLIEGEAARRTETLERRVEKLRAKLAEVEGRLHDLAEERDRDPGLPSIYREVEGLDPADLYFEKKRSILKIIFEDNLDLQKTEVANGDGRRP